MHKDPPSSSHQVSVVTAHLDRCIDHKSCTQLTISKIKPKSNLIKTGFRDLLNSPPLLESLMSSVKNLPFAFVSEEFVACQVSGKHFQWSSQ